MATVYHPIINPEDLKAFRFIIGSDLADTYDVWRDLILNRIQQVARNGDIPRGVEIHPHEFDRWIAASNWSHATVDGLFAFAGIKGARIDNQ